MVAREGGVGVGDQQQPAEEAQRQAAVAGHRDGEHRERKQADHVVLAERDDADDEHGRDQDLGPRVDAVDRGVGRREPIEAVEGRKTSGDGRHRVDSLC